MAQLKFTLNITWLVLVLLVVSPVAKGQNQPATGVKTLSSKQVDELMGKGKAIWFVENKGQWPAHVIYKADVPGWQMLATPEGGVVICVSLRSVTCLLDQHRDHLMKHSGDY